MNQDPIIEMATLEKLTNRIYSPKEWLNYYKNVWMKQNMARTVDIVCDTIAKFINPDEEVQNNPGEIMKVKERLEIRKLNLQDGLKISAGIDELLSKFPEDLKPEATPQEATVYNQKIEEANKKFFESFWSEEALKVSEDMIPKVGDTCTLPDGRDGVLGEMDGKLVCVEKTLPEEEVPEAVAENPQDEGSEAAEV